MDYDSAIAYLESFKSRGIMLGLNRIKKVLRALGDPQKSYTTIHIAGTNGKGSVAAMLSSILTNAGYRTGLYTSPHLIDYTERIRINDKDVSKARFASAVSRVKKAMAVMRGLKLTEFEVLTAASFLLMAMEKVRIAVVEVGLGGRFDSTNVITPVLSIITNIGMDHTDLLGSSLASIAGEKGGIIKPGVPLVSGEKKMSSTLKYICKKNRSRYIQAVKDNDYVPPLLGAHQMENMDVALTAVDLLSDLGYGIKKEVIKRGLACTRWPGRLEILRSDPLIIIDGAHNVPGAKALARHLRDYRKKFNIVIGMQSNKDIGGVVKVLRPFAKKFFVTRSGNPLSQKESVIANICGKSASIAQNIASAIAQATRSETPVCIMGSLYLIGDVLKQKTFDYKRNFLYNNASKWPKEKI